mmetsp:Transcript_22147/g.28658  ORF Transcript_22147/g.28658 Transcript_22147/m.28658 type:complete len:109 (+) Transcript_22147:226-552(+)
MSNPGHRHWVALKTCLRYIKGTLHFGLRFYGKSGCTYPIIGYSDSDHARDPDTRRSVTGFYFYLHGDLVSYNSSKQPTVALYSSEAECMALSAASNEAVWLQRLLTEM